MKVGINGASRDISDFKVGINGAVHSVGEVWIGVNGAVKQVWPNVEFFYEEKTFALESYKDTTISFEVPFKPAYIIGVCSTGSYQTGGGDCVRCFSYSPSEKSFWGIDGDLAPGKIYSDYIDISSEVSSVTYSNGIFSFAYHYDIRYIDPLTYSFLAVKQIGDSSYLGENLIEYNRNWGYKFYTGFEPNYFLAYVKETIPVPKMSGTNQIYAISKGESVNKYIDCDYSSQGMYFSGKNIGSEFSYSNNNMVLSRVTSCSFASDVTWTWLAVKEK